MEGTGPQAGLPCGAACLPPRCAEGQGFKGEPIDTRVRCHANRLPCHPSPRRLSQPGHTYVCQRPDRGEWNPLRPGYEFVSNDEKMGAFASVAPCAVISYGTGSRVPKIGISLELSPFLWNKWLVCVYCHQWSSYCVVACPAYITKVPICSNKILFSLLKTVPTYS